MLKSAGVIAIVVALLLLPGVFTIARSFAATTPTYTPEVNLSTGTGTVHLEPTLVANGSHVFISYEASKGKVQNAQLYFTECNDSGSAFSKPLMISLGTGENGQQRLAINGNYVYVVWMDNQSSSYASILFRANNNFGGHTAWLPVVNLTTSAIFDNAANGTCSLLCGDPTIAVNGTWVYVAWVEQHAIGGETVMFDSSKNNGKTWSGPVDLQPNDPNTPHEQEMAAWGNDVYITWDDHSSFFTVSHNNGMSIYGGTNVIQNLTALETPNPNGGDRS